MPGTSETIPYVIFHVAGNHPASWNTDILPWLRNYGLFFEAVSQRDWVGKLASSDSDVSRNPPYKLLEFFKSNIQADNPLQVTSLERLPAQVYLDITQASKYAPSLAEAGRLDERLMRKYLDYWKKESWQKLERNLVVEGHDKEMGSG
jgi:hypothetical protein